MTALAVNDALLAALQAAHGNVPVYQHVPPKAEPPYVVIGQFVTGPSGGKGDPGEEHKVEILTWCRAPSRKPLHLLMARNRAALDDATIEAAGLEPIRVFHIDSRDELMEDGATYYGVQRFTVFADPA